MAAGTGALKHLHSVVGVLALFLFLTLAFVVVEHHDHLLFKLQRMKFLQKRWNLLAEESERDWGSKRAQGLPFILLSPPKSFQVPSQHISSQCLALTVNSTGAANAKTARRKGQLIYYKTLLKIKLCSLRNIDWGR